MRKHQQKQILEVLQTIEQAQSEGLYADCQEGAISVGEFIESIEGEGTKTVELLEEYCEELFKVHTGEASDKTLRKHLVLIQNSVKRELEPNRLEVVLLPYQVSMWDSLESIYLAAKDDPDCDVFVVPIPYYELNPDGTLGLMHYHGNLYPKNIPITNWQDYNYEINHPDVIFTHYPYDDNVSNYSIHPVFYSQKLREHCELLVHVPYYVTPAPAVEDYYVYLPGVVFADRVILQSEEIRQSCIDYHKKYDKEFGWNGQFGKAEEKYLALGSPKIDKAINDKREDYEIPPEWRQLIENPDGTIKKIVLYNTHMWTWLRSAEAYFKKLRSVFDTFKNRNDVVLWWRPHPNTEANFRVKLPELIGEYKAAIDVYKSEGWGIFDDTPDLHRAIAWSDAYYGDWSSLVTLCQAAGKPVTIQDIEITPESDEIVLQFENLFDDGEQFWFTEYRFNALFRMDKNTWEAEYMGSFPDEDIVETRLYTSITKCNDKLYFAPLSANEIAEYDIKTSEFKMISFTQSTKTPHSLYEKAKLNKIVTLGNYVVFLPYLYPGIIFYDTETQFLSYHDDWVDEVEKSRTVENAGYFTDYILDNSRLILPCFCADAVVIFSTAAKTSEVWLSPSSDHKFKYCSIYSDGDNFYLVSADGTIVKREMISEGETIAKVDLPKIDFDIESDLIAFYPTQYKDGYLWLFPYMRNEAWRLDIASGETTIVDAFNNERKYAGHIRSFIGVEIIDGQIYAMTGRSKRLIEYDPKTNREKAKQITLSSSDSVRVKEQLARYFSKQSKAGFFSESTIITLEIMLDELNCDRITPSTLKTENPGTAAKTIYENAKKIYFHRK